MRDRLYPGAMLLRTDWRGIKRLYIVVAVSPNDGLDKSQAWKVLLLGDVLIDALIHEATENVTWLAV